eukprot:GHRR01026254.1.p1 GENE.GHRR01026254.1~~GHRR01026254.1.p1  ORF type:complete len:195 (+),score=71.07 GHRR01026254.1:454-1038(+)
MQVLKFAQDLGLTDVNIQECGCLGNCGNGPNMLLTPEEVTLGHVATPADMADILRWQLDVQLPDKQLKATELRLAGNQLAVEGDLQGAAAKYSQALNLNATGQHMLHSNLSAVYLQLGDKQAALQHAEAAVQHAPHGFHVAYVRLIDALYACGRYSEAAVALQVAVRQDPGFKTVPEYKVIGKALKQAGVRLRV